MMRIGFSRPVQKAALARFGSVLIVVLWVSFGLVTLTLYFAQAMGLELRTADHRVAKIEAGQAIHGAARYVRHILSQYATNGTFPSVVDYGSEAMPVGAAWFWILGRDEERTSPPFPAYGLIDEASKINLNTATREMLEALPRMTTGLAGAILDWRDEDEEPTEDGAEDETYGRLTPPRRAKNAPFESVEELRLVYGATLEILFGEDSNRNGLLDWNENDGDTTPPSDNRDGRLDPGLIEYVTVYSRQPNTRADGSARIDVSIPQGRDSLSTLLSDRFGDERANEILGRLGGNVRSVLEFYVASGMTADEFAQIRSDITTGTGSYREGLVNVNTASEAVLAAIPGIGTDKAPALTAFRVAHPDQLNSLAWVSEVIEGPSIAQAGPYLTDQSYQFTADITALGHEGRGLERVRFVFDTTEAAPKILVRQDQTGLGWPLGQAARRELQRIMKLRP